MNNQINLKELFVGYDKDVPIIIHNYPDPDCIGSALAVHHVLKSNGIKAGSIYYSGEISHPQNKSMLTLLNISMVNIESNPPENDSKAVLIDTNNIGEGSNQPYIKPDQIEIMAVIDHHKGKSPKNAKIDNRNVGACSSILWEYLKDLNYDFTTEEGELLATALILGIITDTNQLTSDNIADLDFDAYRDLLKHINRQKLVQLINYPLPSYLFELRQKAFLEENYKLDDATLVSGLGIITPAKRDAIPIIADEFLRMTGVTTSIVFAVIENKIDISVRSKNITLDVDAFVKTVFKNGGGKMGSGRAIIPLDFFYVDDNDLINNEVWNIAKKIVMTKVFQNVKGS